MSRHISEFSVIAMCKVLSVSRSSFYVWQRSSPLQSAKREKILQAITDVFRESREAYGSPRVFKQMRAMGWNISKSMVERVMRKNGLRARKRRKFRILSASKNRPAASPNWVERVFDRGEVNKVWLSDITYLPTQEGFVYLATILDAHSRKIIGWSIDNQMESTLVIQALQLALARRSHPQGVIVHSDQGSQYASQDYRLMLKEHGLIQSMSRRGNCWDNAPMESFFDSLKTEHASHEKYANLKEARQKIFEWIEIFYNNKRIHSSLGYVSPACFEENHMAIAA